MVLSTNMDFIRRIYGEEKAIEVIADTGFDAIDFSMGNVQSPDCPWMKSDYRQHAQDILRLADAHGVYFNQAHAPVPVSATGQNTKDVLKNISYESMERTFEICGLLKIPHVIVHGIFYPEISVNSEMKLEANIAYFRKLKELAEPHGVRVALENIMKTFARPYYFSTIMNELNDDFFLACVDVGHCNVVNNGSGELIRTLGKRVQALHLHDNHVDYDEHLIPGTGNADWNEILSALADIHYSGDFTLELSDHATSCMRDDLGFDRSFFPTALKYSQQTARYLIRKLERMMG